MTPQLITYTLATAKHQLTILNNLCLDTFLGRSFLNEGAMTLRGHTTPCRGYK